MKRFLLLLLALSLLAYGAGAENVIVLGAKAGELSPGAFVDVGYDYSVKLWPAQAETCVRDALRWDAEDHASGAHHQFALFTVTLANLSMDTIDAGRVLFAKAVFDGAYEYPAKLLWRSSADAYQTAESYPLDMLVEKDFTFVIQVPNFVVGEMPAPVAKANEGVSHALTFVLTVGEDALEYAMDVWPKGE